MGAGTLPTGELPARLHSFTPQNEKEAHSVRMTQAARELAPLLKINEQLKDFCLHPDSVVSLSVLPENEKYIFTKQYKIAHALRKAVSDIINRWKSTGKIKLAPKNCPFNSPLLAVPKKDDQGKMTGVRLCTDVRVLNKYLIEDDRFQLPHIPDVLTAFAGGQFFGEFDLSEAYFQFRLNEKSQKYTAFQWEGEQYTFVGCPFGLKHIPSFFQRFISNLFRDMPFVYPYIDNLGFASKTWEEHLMHAKMIIERLNSVNLRIKPASYNIGNTQIKLLGHVITRSGICLDPEKRDMILNWPRPNDGAGLASALGLGAYLRDHVRHYADISAPLERVKRQKEISWTPALNESWELFKRAFASAPLLSFPDFNKRFVLATDASQTGIGGVLYQPNDENDTITADNIVAICSKQLNATQQNYPVYKKELWGLIYCLRKFHTFLWGRRDVKVLTDHKPLVHIMSQKNMTVALQQWMDVILDYDLTIQYRPGVLHVVPDALSRMYTSAYQDRNVPWGTLTNIHFLNVVNDESNFSPSDFLCERSLSEIKPPSNTKKRHAVSLSHSKSRGGTDRNQSHSVFENETDEEDKNVGEPFPYIRSLSVDDLRADDMMININGLETEGPDEIDAGPLFAASDEYTARLARLAVKSHQSDSSLIDIQSIIDWQANVTENELRAEGTHAFIRSLSVSSSEMNEDKSSESMLTDINIAMSTPVETLSNEEKLLLLQERRGKVIPNVSKRTELITSAHAAGHFGEKAMYSRIECDGYWWPSLRNDIKAVIAQCNDCRRFTVVTHGYHPAKSIEAKLPGDHYQVDLAMLPTSSEGYRYCLVLVDIFSGFLILKPLKTKKASEIARMLWEIFALVGTPKILQSDNGAEFVNQIVRTLVRLQGIEQRFISQYNPRADGKVERAVRTVKQTVMKLLHGADIYWPLHLPFVQYSYNSKVQALTGSTPFALMFARIPNAAADYQSDPSTGHPINLGEWRKRQEEMLSLILPAVGVRVSEQQRKYRERLDKKRKVLVTAPLSVGTVVMIKDPMFMLNPDLRPASEPAYIGPYIIQRVTKFGTYILTDETGERLERSVPLDQIKVLIEPGKNTSIPLPPTSQSEETDETVYVMESILDHRVNSKGELEYMIKWKGYPKSQSTWTNERRVIDYALISAYFRSRFAAAPPSVRKPRLRTLSSGIIQVDLSRVSLLASLKQSN